MKKKFLYFLLLSCILGGIFYFNSSNKSEDSLDSSYCAFCDPEVLNRQKFYEDGLVLALYTHKPVFPGHCLIIPKRHVERFEQLTDDEMNQMGRVIKKVNEAASKVFNTSSYLLLQKNGLEVGQTVPHVHFHYIPRQTGDTSTLKFLISMFLSNIKKPISNEEMQKIVQQLKKEMS